MSPPMGKGFQIKDNFEGYRYDFPVTQVLMLACGTGLAPIAAAIDSSIFGLKTTSYNSLFAKEGLLYIGAKTPEHLPCSADFKRWESQGVKIIPVISKPTSSWTGRTGYVQDALKQDGIKVPRNTGALICGYRGLIESSKELLLEAGVFEGRILLNF